MDCPNNGVCCFNGCSNQCGIPESDEVIPPGLAPVIFPKTTTTASTTTTTATTTTCSVVMQEVEETVMKEMCQTVPGPEICTNINEEECAEECSEEYVPAAPECTLEPHEVCTSY